MIVIFLRKQFASSLADFFLLSNVLHAFVSSHFCLHTTEVFVAPLLNHHEIERERKIIDCWKEKKLISLTRKNGLAFVLYVSLFLKKMPLKTLCCYDISTMFQPTNWMCLIHLNREQRDTRWKLSTSNFIFYTVSARKKFKDDFGQQFHWIFVPSTAVDWVEKHGKLSKSYNMHIYRSMNVPSSYPNTLIEIIRHSKCQ